jgi:ribosomal protein S18 acetylase RimI-like enzyme
MNKTGSAAIKAERFATALDEENYDGVAGLLSAECEYAAPKGLLIGRQAILASYRDAGVWVKSNIQIVRYESTVRITDENRAIVTFIDHLEHNGLTHTYTCQQEVDLDSGGFICRIVHQELPGEREAVESFLRVAGIDRAGAVTVRRMVESDSRAVVELWHHTKRDAYPYLPLEQGRSLEEDSEFFHQKLLPRFDIWVAEREGRLVGFLAICGSYIDRLYVFTEAQRRGIGTALLRHAMNLSPGGLELHTHEKNLGARRFYEKHGFRAVRFGKSPLPENEPDVEYHWRP